MKITIKEEGIKTSIEIPDGSTTEQVVQYFEGLLVAHTYHPDSVKQAILNRAYDYKFEDSISIA